MTFTFFLPKGKSQRYSQTPSFTVTIITITQTFQHSDRDLDKERNTVKAADDDTVVYISGEDVQSSNRTFH